MVQLNAVFVGVLEFAIFLLCNSSARYFAVNLSFSVGHFLWVDRAVEKETKSLRWCEVNACKN